MIVREPVPFNLYSGLGRSRRLVLDRGVHCCLRILPSIFSGKFRPKRERSPHFRIEINAYTIHFAIWPYSTPPGNLPLALTPLQNMRDALSTSFILVTISLIPIPYNRYILWSLSSASLILYTANRQRPSNKLGQLEALIDAVSEILALAKATCKMNYAELVDLTRELCDSASQPPSCSLPHLRAPLSKRPARHLHASETTRSSSYTSYGPVSELRNKELVDVFIGGGGPAGLSVAIPFGQLESGTSSPVPGVILKQDAETRSHILSDAVIDLTTLDVLCPPKRTVRVDGVAEGLHGQPSSTSESNSAEQREGKEQKSSLSHPTPPPSPRMPILTPFGRLARV
ncbi:hypothetical protein MSAN_02353300 [Mycena sanguinolenta]|uniref:Uncharacterized protein n=1 Tax=Mycena sanguinolenta TaxID=230812 RepID=A0A8H7CFB3_9AGAR|nr:hypothetical protein MSAN_02353300 [Mycena sanguinolenta]